MSKSIKKLVGAQMARILFHKRGNLERITKEKGRAVVKVISTPLPNFAQSGSKDELSIGEFPDLKYPPNPVLVLVPVANVPG